MFRLVFGIVIMALLSALVAPRTAGAASPVSAAAFEAAADKPLMVIRFNQQRVFYKQPLYTACSKALQIAPAARFHLISYMPAPANELARERVQGIAATNLRQVADTMRQMGVPSQQIAVNTQIAPDLTYDEVHIFVH